MTFGLTRGGMINAPSSAAKDPSGFLRDRLHALRVERENFLRVMTVSRSVNRLGDSNLGERARPSVRRQARHRRVVRCSSPCRDHQALARPP